MSTRSATRAQQSQALTTTATTKTKTTTTKTTTMTTTMTTTKTAAAAAKPRGGGNKRRRTIPDPDNTKALSPSSLPDVTKALSLPPPPSAAAAAAEEQSAPLRDLGPLEEGVLVCRPSTRNRSPYVGDVLITAGPHAGRTAVGRGNQSPSDVSQLLGAIPISDGLTTPPQAPSLPTISASPRRPHAK
jgi:hypothetical protein